MSAFNPLSQNDDNLKPDFLSAPSIELALSSFEKPMKVDLEGFFEFSFDLAEDLLDLEAQFKPRRQLHSDRSSLIRPTKSA
jgi:hypothetical protein